MENRPLKDLSVPGLKRRGITLTNTTKSNLDGTHILKDPSNPGAARISYRPRLESLQHLLKSNHALQFSVKYDVDRQSDKAGEIQAQYIYSDSKLLLSPVATALPNRLKPIYRLFLSRETCTVHSISTQASREGIECIKAKK